MLTAVWAFFITEVPAQSVYYPAAASQLLQATATDVAMLLRQASSGRPFNIQSYSIIPAQGIIFKYDSTITDNQSCKVQSNGMGEITFSAAEDNGLNYGIYQYLQDLGFRFYQPGTIWEIIPSLASPYKVIDTIYSCKYLYKTWFISGGHNKWAMDNSNEYPWDAYFGENGHQWALYQRRNNMTGASSFNGHRDEIMDDAYVTTLQNNPCYIAPYNGTRIANRQSVADINNPAAMQLWESAIEQHYTQFKNTIYGNQNLYANFFRNFNFNYGHVGLEVPDGAHWANSTDNSGCGNNNLLKESDQHFTLANFTAAKFGETYPDKRFQLYAYDGHADVPSANITINPKIDIQIIPTAFQSETSVKGLANRWYHRSGNISEYHYLNLPQWSGETPSFFLDELKQTIERIQENNAQGIVFEASPAKFASLPFLMAINAALKDGIPVDSTIQRFCTTLFGNGASAISKLMLAWSNDKSLAVYNGIQDNKYKFPFYLTLLKEAVNAAANDAPVVKQRINELKAYLHYMALFYDWAFDQRAYTLKAGKAATLCLYLAKVNKLKLVNSYFLISDIVNKYPATDPMYINYNVSNGLAYQNGQLPLITTVEIEQNFNTDLVRYANTVQQYNFEDVAAIKASFENNNLAPLEKIDVKISYTSGKDYPNRSEFYFVAGQAGNISIHYTPHFDMPGKGNINFTVEDAEKSMTIIKDFSITNMDAAGTLAVSFPAAGFYKLTVVSKYKSAVDLQILTNGNHFFKNGPYIGNTTENYRDNLLSLPGYFHIPAGISKVYFSVNNSYSGATGFVSAAAINNTFLFKDENNNAVEVKLANTTDSALFYLDIPANTGGKFWKITKMENARLTFANISNIQWYASPKLCTGIDFSTTIIKKNGQCFIQLKTPASNANILWKVCNNGKCVYYADRQVIDLPASTSPNALVTLSASGACSITKRIGDEHLYLQQLQQCASEGQALSISATALVYPNPGTGVYNCQQNGNSIIAEKIMVHSTSGALLASFTNTSQFNISHLPGGVYFYTLVINRVSYRCKLVKL